MSAEHDPTSWQQKLCINPKLDLDVKDWSIEFDVSPEQLRAAVQVVGPAAQDVQNFLQRRREVRAS